MSAIVSALNLLSPEQKRKFYFLTGLMIVTMLLELLGIGMVLPVMSLLSNHEITTHYPILKQLGLSHSFHQTDSLFLIAIGVVFLVFLFKSLFIVYSGYKQSQFTFNIQSTLSKKLFEIYLAQPWEFFLKRNSASLGVTITNEVSLFTNYLIGPFMLILSEGIVVLGVTGFLLFIQPIGTMASFALFSSLFYVFQKKSHVYIKRLGEKRLKHESERIKAIQNGLQGIKDARILGREQAFLNQFNLENEAIAKIGSAHKVFTDAPRPFIELLSILIIGILSALLVLQHQSLDATVSILALFALSAFRLMPSFNRIFSSIQNTKYGLPVLEKLSEELAHQQQSLSHTQSMPSFPFNQKIEIQNLHYHYPDSSKPVIQNINFEILKGRSVAFIGPSGVGKSTLVDLLLGLLIPSEGCILVDGQNIRNNTRGWQNQIGYVPQSIFLIDDTIKNNIAFGLEPGQVDEAKLQQAIANAELQEFIDGLEEKENTLIGERGVRLSGGQRQRIGIARALYHEPNIIFFDEATSALDNETEAAVMKQIIRLKGKKTIIIVAHRLSTVQHCDTIFKLDKGTIIKSGNYTEVVG